jgi:hypothetical protein
MGLRVYFKLYAQGDWMLGERQSGNMTLVRDGLSGEATLHKISAEDSTVPAKTNSTSMWRPQSFHGSALRHVRYNEKKDLRNCSHRTRLRHFDRVDDILAKYIQF